MTDPGDAVLQPGRSCWRIEPAERFALIIDAADYFRHAKAAMLKARSRIRQGRVLDPEQRSASVAQRLAGNFRDFASRLKLRRSVQS